METSDFVQLLTLWYVVIIGLQTVDPAGSIGIVFSFVGLGLMFFLPLYIIGSGIVELTASPRT